MTDEQIIKEYARREKQASDSDPLGPNPRAIILGLAAETGRSYGELRGLMLDHWSKMERV